MDGLVRLAYETIHELMSEAAGDHKARPGVVAVPQTFGSVLNVHPHAHCLASRGLWDENGQWLIAVGTAVAGGPPHRSVRECLPHTAPTLSRA